MRSHGCAMVWAASAAKACVPCVLAKLFWGNQCQRRCFLCLFQASAALAADEAPQCRRMVHDRVHLILSSHITYTIPNQTYRIILTYRVFDKTSFDSSFQPFFFGFSGQIAYGWEGPCSGSIPGLVAKAHQRVFWSQERVERFAHGHCGKTFLGKMRFAYISGNGNFNSNSEVGFNGHCAFQKPFPLLSSSALCPIGRRRPSKILDTEIWS